ncbi:unnamed protein product [Lampetra fluviatilis]
MRWNRWGTRAFVHLTRAGTQQRHSDWNSLGSPGSRRLSMSFGERRRAARRRLWPRSQLNVALASVPQSCINQGGRWTSNRDPSAGPSPHRQVATASTAAATPSSQREATRPPPAWSATFPFQSPYKIVVVVNLIIIVVVANLIIVVIIIVIIASDYELRSVVFNWRRRGRTLSQSRDAARERFPTIYFHDDRRSGRGFRGSNLSGRPGKFCRADTIVSAARTGWFVVTLIDKREEKEENSAIAWEPATSRLDSTFYAAAGLSGYPGVPADRDAETRRDRETQRWKGRETFRRRDDETERQTRDKDT